MIVSNTFFNCMDLPEKMRFSMEKERMKVYFDLERECYVCHEVRHQQHRKQPEQLINRLYKDSKHKYDLENPRPFRLNSEYKNERLEGIKKILRKSIEKNKQYDEDLQSLLEKDNLSFFVEEKLNDEAHQERAKRKRFDRKAGLNRDRWDYFWTQTFDPALFANPEQGLETLFRWIKNNADRYGIKVLGAVEFGEENGRIHFHALIHIPDEFLKRLKLKPITRYSIRGNKWKTSPESEVLRQKFGINEFDSLHGKNAEELLKVVRYISSYACKQDGRRYYSRGLPDCGYQYVDSEDLFFQFDDGEIKYIPCDSFKFGKDSVIAIIRSRDKGKLCQNEELPFRESA